MYQVIGHPKSRSFRVLWVLEEIGAVYDHDPAAPRSEAALAVNPSGKVPILIEGETKITDSVAIITYLADKHGALTYPAGTLERAQQDGWTQFLIDEFDAALWLAARHSFVLPPDRRLPEIKESVKWEFSRSLKVLDSRMGEGPFLMGKMTIADILLTHCCNWAESARFAIDSPRLADYLAAMRQRPAYLRAMAL